MSSAIVVVNELEKRYKAKIAVDHICFQVNQGEVFGLLGPNGAGKTTTLECIEGLRRFDGGSITVEGHDVNTDEKELRKILGVQLQSSSLPDSMHPIEAMIIICGWHKVSVRQDLLLRFGLEQELKKPYFQLSIGQKRRLHLALALATDPKVVILDEPTAGLDVQGRADLHKAIKDLKTQGMTFILATHDMAEAEILCDRIAIMINGRIRVVGTPAQITAAGDKKTRITFRTVKGSLLPGKDIPYAHFDYESEGYISWISTEIAKAVTFLLQQVENANDQIEDLIIERPSLKERFLELVEGVERK